MKKTVAIFLLAVVAYFSFACTSANSNDHVGAASVLTTSIVPSSGVSGDWAIISGTGFTGSVSVSVGDKPAQITSKTSKRIQIELPSNQAGTYPVSVTCGEQTASNLRYTYLTDGPVETDPDKDAIAEAVGKADLVRKVMESQSRLLSEGVFESDFFFQTVSGTIVHAYIVMADLNTPGVNLSVCTPYKAMEPYNKKQTLTKMTNLYDAPGARVAAMINGDFWDTSLLVPRGPIHHEGVIINEEFNYSERVPQQALSYVALRKDGRMLIDFKESYPSTKSDLKEATGAGVVLVKDGIIPTISPTWTALDPRTAIGYTEKNVVYLLVADGRAENFSNGLTYAQMSSIFVALGCKAAANLDGGGSAQILTRNPETGKGEIRNRPSDGKERAVFNGWMVTVKE